MIDCVTISTSHFFRGNPIYEQHRLRHKCIVQRQGWNVPAIRSMEYDQYDNPAAYYLVWRDWNGKAYGSSRLCPTDRPYMLEEIFPAPRHQDEAAQERGNLGGQPLLRR
jgi:N-acyl-L-homoserine lactone synthetase